MGLRQLCALAAFACSAALTPPAFAHAKLLASQPAANSVLDVAPAVMRLQFSDTVELAFSKVRLVDQAGVAGAPLKIAGDGSNPKALIATLPPLKPGRHRVQWSTVTRDGHKVKGDIAFQVR